MRSFWNLHDCLFRDATTILAGEAVIAGTGGLGKTQLAIEYAHRFGSVYTGGVYWVDADQGLSTLISQIGEAAGIEFDKKADEANQVEQIWRGLSRLPGPSLVILDNFPENVELQPYLPVGGRVHTLITTRRQDLDYPLVRLNILTTEEGIRLLIRHAMSLRQRTGRWKLRSFGEIGIIAHGATQLTANPGIVFFKVLNGRYIDRLNLAEETRKTREIPAGPKHQRPHLAFESFRVVSDTAGPFYFRPLRVAEIRRQDEDHKLALVQRPFKGPDPVLSPSDRLTIKKARNAVPSQAAIQLPDEILVLTTVTEEDTIGRVRHKIRTMLPQASQESENKLPIAAITLELPNQTNE
ncbi:MAG TPA: hypothetical protein VHA33_10660 [Candidatus Angelobacter sp.]|nr:hypothetical protein [Candidatus Angelobacter sp.]